MNQYKKNDMKTRILQAYWACKSVLYAYHEEENLKSLEKFGVVIDEMSAFVDAFDHSPLFQILNDIRQTAYEKYQHDWMISHNVDEKALDKAVKEYIADTLEDNNLDTPFSEWLFDRGFDGSIWACYDEFLNAEYRDYSYMRNLLSAKEYPAYLADMTNF
ncbi:hypothetical protein [Blautia sp. 1033sp1_1033st1_G9_1033SCRN_220408]|uniref:hypothetical protein n=1 Tax=Blautia sp. 1033sp1_1033st1_G9_1033SCRN_220408 TaxID=3144490 RepID=UPI0034A47E55